MNTIILLADSQPMDWPSAFALAAIFAISAAFGFMFHRVSK